MTGKTVVIVQSNYIPWKGYFDLIASADELILLDDAQYTRRDWRNRNKVKSASGSVWLTIPVAVKGLYSQKIYETRVAESDWQRRHWRTIVHHYSRAACFRTYAPFFEELFLGCAEDRLTGVNSRFISAICRLLEIPTRISWSMDYTPKEGRTERLVDLCLRVGATQYLSGPAARAYLDVGQFSNVGIAVRWMDYGGYEKYPQVHPPFDHFVSIVDLILNTGSNARRFMKVA